MFVRWTVHDFIIGLLWLCVCVCVGTHCPRALSIHAKISSLSPHFFCIFFSVLSLFLYFFYSELDTPLFLSYCVLMFLFFFLSFHLSHLVFSHLISSCLISSLFLYSYLFLFHLICSFLILSHIVLIFSHLCPILSFLSQLNLSFCLVLSPLMSLSFLLSFHFIYLVSFLLFHVHLFFSHLLSSLLIYALFFVLSLLRSIFCLI